jgi:hypothetical protein
VRRDSGARLQAREQDRWRPTLDTSKWSCFESGERLGTSLRILGDRRAVLPEKESAPVVTIEQLVVGVDRALCRLLDVDEMRDIVAYLASIPPPTHPAAR